MTDLPSQTLAQLSKAIRERTISPITITQAYIDRIEALDHNINSFNCVRADEALAEAALAEKKITAGNWRGPLHGIPIGIKDLIDVAGVPTTAQTAHRKDHIPAKDAGVVSALKNAGAIILGKQATSEYAVGGTQFDLPWPPVRNPWNTKMDASSSSSGSAAAAVAGFCAGSIGTETAGSIRAPAAWCGAAGLKPTDRLVNRSGVLPLSQTMDCVGPIAWTVEDCALLLSGMVSNDPTDRATAGFRAPDLERLTNGISGLRIGVVRNFYENDPDMDPEVLIAMDRSLRLLAQLGAKLSTVNMDDFSIYNSTAKSITWPEEYAVHGNELRNYPDRFAAITRSRLQDGKDVSAPDYINALWIRKKLIEDLGKRMADVDLLVLPTMKTPAKELGYEHQPDAFDTSLTRPFNLTGNPALTLCNGFSRDGLPISIQIVGKHFDDDLVLAAGHALEIALGERVKRPEIG